MVAVSTENKSGVIEMRALRSSGVRAMVLDTVRRASGVHDAAK